MVQFCTNGTITLADSIAIFIRALGLESMALLLVPSQPSGIMTRYLTMQGMLFMVEKIGLIKGDNRGHLKPRESLTKVGPPFLLTGLSNICEVIRKSYREGIINFN